MERQTTAAKPTERLISDLTTDALLNQELLAHVDIGLGAVFYSICVTTQPRFTPSPFGGR